MTDSSISAEAGSPTGDAAVLPTDGAGANGQADSSAGTVGRVAGTEDSTPLQFAVALDDASYLQLDDVVVTLRQIPGVGPVLTSGIVTQVRARHEGASFGSDVFLISDGVLPARVQEIAEVSDLLVDAIVAHGDSTAVAVKVREHLLAGADHVTLLLPIGGEFTAGVDQLGLLTDKTLTTGNAPKPPDAPANPGD